MRHRRLGPSLIAALTLTAAAAPAAPAGDVAGQLPTLAIRHRTLSNGLDVYSVEDHTTPTVAIQVSYRVGSKDDPPGRSGFAHLFEHLMFKRTRNMPAEMMDRLTEDVGGWNDATTLDDATLFYEVVPSRYLEPLLWAEAERMATLRVDAASFAAERGVVEEEYRQRVDATPYGALYARFLPESAFLVHPYRRPGIGSINDLESATLEDVQAFHHTYYRPDNAVLVVVGDFAPQQLDAWVDRYLGPIPRPHGTLPRVAAVEPPRDGERRFVYYHSDLPLPAVAIDFLVPPAADASAPASLVTEALFSAGNSSRLNERLVHQQEVASEAFAWSYLLQDAGLFVVAGVAANGKAPADVERALLAEVDRLKNEPVPVAELDKVKRQLLTGRLLQLRRAIGKANAVSNAVVLLGDAEAANAQLARLLAVTPADVQAYAQRFFREDNRVVLHYLSEDAKPAAPAAVEAAADKVEKPPGPGPAVAPTVPQAVERRLPNGLRVVAVQTQGVPLTTARLLVRGGAAADPADRAGLADLTARLLQRGTASRSAADVATAVESLGGSLDSAASWDGSSATVTVLTAQLAPALDLLADVVEHPAFAADELDKLRRERLDQLSVDAQEPGELAALAAQREVFGARPYGHALGGTPTSLTAIGRDDLRSFHTRVYRPDDAALIIAGTLAPEETIAAATRAFGGWPRPRTRPSSEGSSAPTAVRSAPSPTEAGSAQPASVLVVDLPGAGQAAVAVAGETMLRRDPRYAASQVLNAVFGGGYSARLNHEVRIERALSYGAISRLDARRLGGYFLATAQTKNPSAPEVASVMLDLLAALAATAPPADELQPRKAALGGDFNSALETTTGLVGQLGELVLHDLPLSELQRYLPAVEAVPGEAVRTLAAEELRPADLHLVVVGDGKIFLDALRQRFPQLRVTTAGKLLPGLPAPPAAAAGGRG
ncbi:MAG TPA: pitrilysin family protein [Thermoanaerobaculia bacterium]|jgi:zinc protease|nr:pitrilysin family protein [Thermoanaerobaculia bacterium]